MKDEDDTHLEARPEDEGRKLLAEWKVAHVEWANGGACAAQGCENVWPCPTARLVAAVELALQRDGSLGHTDSADILAKLAPR